MQITVKLYATLRRYGPESHPEAGFSLDIPAGSDVERVAQLLGIPDGVALVAMVNNEVVHVDHVLVSGDRLCVFPPVAGG